MATSDASRDTVSAQGGKDPVRVMQFICSTGFYGAEGWILALANNSQSSEVVHHLAVTREWETHDLELTRRYGALGLPTHELPMKGRFDLRVIRQLVQLIRDNHIDVIHTHGYKSDLLGIVAARLAGIASVCTPHGFENARDWKLRTYIRLGCESFRFFDRVVPLSPALFDQVARFRVPKERLAYVRNGVDLLPVHAEREKRVRGREAAGGLPESGPPDQVLGYIGQLIDRKNVGDILAVFDTLASQHAKLRLVIVGEGGSRKALELQASQSPYRERIEFRGFVNNPLAHLREFDLFIMTSSMEGIPRCLMEAMSMGVPVAAYDIPGVDQLIEHEVTGSLAKFGDQASLAQHCDHMLSNQETRADIARMAAQKVEENFSAARMASQYADVYREILAERSA